MKKLLLLIFVGLLTVNTSTNVFAQELSIEEIIDKANLASYYEGNDGSADVHMTITDSQDRVRERDFKILRLDQEDGGEQKFYVYFKKPTDVAKMVFMVWKHLERDDDRWLYLPALDLVRRIAASDKRSSFVGSHFVYEDVSGRGTEEDVHVLEGTDDTYYKVKNTPKSPEGQEFAYYYLWINKNTFLPEKAEYYNADDKLMRSIEALEIEDIDGHPTVTKSVAKDFERGGQTTMEFSNVEYDIGLTDDIFQERYLRRAPARWIR